MTSTDTTLAAYAVTVEGYGDLEVTVEVTDAYGDFIEYAARSAPQAKGYDPNKVLADLGYRRVSEWTLTVYGAVCDVEPKR